MRISVLTMQSGSQRLDLDGYAIGGLAVGETHEEMYHILEAVVPYLPVKKPTYLMGVGTPANILEGVDRGVDFFDCVYPTRNGRHGHLYTNQGKINLFNKKYEKDMRPNRRRMSVSGLQTIFKSIYPPSVKGKGNARHASLRASQSVFLQYDDGRDPGCDRKRGISVVQRRKIIWYGTA